MSDHLLVRVPKSELKESASEMRQHVCQCAMHASAGKHSIHIFDVDSHEEGCEVVVSNVPSRFLAVLRKRKRQQLCPMTDKSVGGQW